MFQVLIRHFQDPSGCFIQTFARQISNAMLMALPESASD
jgi:hypothetical protein